MKLPDFNNDPAIKELHRKMGIKKEPELRTACCGAFDTFYEEQHTCRSCHRPNPSMIEAGKLAEHQQNDKLTTAADVAKAAVTFVPVDYAAPGPVAIGDCVHFKHEQEAKARVCAVEGETVFVSHNGRMIAVDRCSIYQIDRLQKSFLDHHQTYAPLRAAVITLPNGERAPVHVEDGPMFHAVWVDLGGQVQAWATPDHETADANATPINIETEEGHTMPELFAEAVLQWTGNEATDCATWAEFVGDHIRAIWPAVERMQGTIEHG